MAIIGNIPYFQTHPYFCIQQGNHISDPTPKFLEESDFNIFQPVQHHSLERQLCSATRCTTFGRWMVKVACHEGDFSNFDALSETGTAEDLNFPTVWGLSKTGFGLKELKLIITLMILMSRDPSSPRIFHHFPPFSHSFAEAKSAIFCSSSRSCEFVSTSASMVQTCDHQQPKCAALEEDLEGSGRIWKDLEGSGRIWKDLEGSGRIWKAIIVNFAKVKCQMLTVLIYVASADLCCKSSQSDASLASVEVADEGQTSSGNLTMYEHPLQWNVKSSTCGQQQNKQCFTRGPMT